MGLCSLTMQKNLHNDSGPSLLALTLAESLLDIDQNVGLRQLSIGKPRLFLVVVGCFEHNSGCNFLADFL